MTAFNSVALVPHVHTRRLTITGISQSTPGWNFFRVEGKREEATSVRAQMIILEVISPPSVIELEFQLTLEGGLNNKSLKSKCKTVSTSDSHRM